MDILKLFLTPVLSVLALFLIAKLMGHKQVAQLDFFDYINGITIGSIAAELATKLETPERPLIALGIYGAASLILNLLTHKFPRLRKYINGTPTILMNDGKLYRKNIKKAKLDLSEFMLLCREQGYFDPEEIECAIFEPNGKLSILPKAQFSTLTPCDMKLEVKTAEIGIELIMDGRILGENLKRMGRDERWLIKRIKEQGYKDCREIFLAIYHKSEDKLSLFLSD